MDYLEVFVLLEQSIYAQYIFIILMGLFVGSFINVLTYRLPLIEDYKMAKLIKDNSKEVNENVNEAIKAGEKLSISFPSSHCPSCQEKIKFYHNIPVFGWLFLKGKCGSCKDKISVEYPLIESINAALWSFALFKFGYSIELLFVLPMVSIGIMISMIDLKHKIIMNGHAEILAFLGLLFALMGLSKITYEQSFLGGFLLFSILYSFVVIYEKIKKVDYHMMGRGDFYVIGALATWVGAESGFIILIYASLIGLIGFVLKGIIKSEDKEMPFIPSMFIAFILVFFNLIPVSLL
jgi:leader peptidase (prepilin peptidase) / N-methyltransferase